MSIKRGDRLILDDRGKKRMVVAISGEKDDTVQVSDNGMTITTSVFNLTQVAISPARIFFKTLLGRIFIIISPNINKCYCVLNYQVVHLPSSITKATLSVKSKRLIFF